MKPDGAGDSLRLPETRLLNKEQAAAYLGIGTTLLEALDIPRVKLGRRCVYDRIDLDAWLDEYKRRGRARKDHSWPVKEASTGDGTPVSGGSKSYCPTADAYAEALKPSTGRTRKPA